MDEKNASVDATNLTMSEPLVPSESAADTPKWRLRLMPLLLSADHELGQIGQQVQQDPLTAIRTLLKHLSLFHPHDVTQHYVFLTTMEKGIVQLVAFAELGQMTQTLLLNIHENIKGAINELTTGQLQHGETFVEVTSELLGTARLRVVAQLPEGWEMRPELINMKESLTYRQEISMLWGDVLVWLMVEMVLFILTCFSLTCLKKNENFFGTLVELITGNMSKDKRIKLGFAQEFVTKENQDMAKNMLYILLPWALIHIGIGFGMCKDKIGKNNTWIFKVVHLVLPILLGVGASFTEADDSLNPVVLVCIPQLVNALFMVPFYLFGSKKLPHWVSKLPLLITMFINLEFMWHTILFPDVMKSSSISGDEPPTGWEPKGLTQLSFAIAFVISAGWSIMFNHDRRLAGTLMDIGQADYKIRHKFHGGIIALIFLLPVVVTALIAAAFFVLCVGLICGCVLCACAKRESTSDHGTHIVVTTYTDQRMEAQGAGLMVGGFCVAFAISWNLALMIVRQETNRTTYKTQRIPRPDD